MDFKSIMKQRFSCRDYTGEKIDNDIIRDILNTALLSPSSLGLEAWQLVVISKPKQLQTLSQICLNQPHVANCSHAVVIMARGDLKSQDLYLREILEQKGKSVDEFFTIMRRFAGKTFDDMSMDEIYATSCKQCYILCANLVNAAINQGIKSCIIGGFDKKKADEFLDLGFNLRSEIIITLGKSDLSATKKIRKNPLNSQIWL